MKITANRFITNKYLSSLSGAAILLIIVSLISRGMGFIREAMFAGFFGLSTEFDLYLIGAVLPITLNTIVLYIGQNFFIPGYQRNKSKDYVVSNFVVFFIICLLAALFLSLFSDTLIRFYIPNLPAEKLRVASIIFRIFIFSLPLNGGISILSAYLQSEFKFTYPALSQLVLNIGVIVIVVLGYSKLHIWAIPWGYLGGSIIQLVYLFYYSKIRISSGFLRKFSNINTDFMSVTFLLIIITESISQLYLICDRYFYTSVDTGGIAALNYAMIIFVLPVSVISIAISTVIFPQMSNFYAENKMEEIKSSLKNYLSMSIFIFLPISFVLFFWGESIIQIFYQRGKFTSFDATLTFTILKIYSISLVFFACYAIVNKVIYSLKLVKQLLVLTVTGIIIKIILNVVLVHIYRQNGLAISTTIVYICFFIMGYYIIRIRIKVSEKYYYIKELLINCMNGVISYLIIFTLIPLDNSVWLSLLSIVLFLLIFILNSFLLNQHQILFLKKALLRG